ncbi:sterol desaturase family protein [bacterium]|nr:sterol desaturase family protein [bacterium]
MWIIAIFWLVFLPALWTAERRSRVFQRPFSEWCLDCAGLLIQGGLVPFIQTVALAFALKYFFPAGAQALKLGAIWAFLLGFLVVDYLYYWNHRLLHRASLWWLHQVHHSARQLDVFVTSRNTIWTSFLILYWFVHGLFLYLLENPAPYLLAMSLTVALDMWRHQGVQGVLSPRALSYISRVFITPVDHAWHHSTRAQSVNYGANFSLWDRLHGTYALHERFPPRVGIPLKITVWQQFVWPKERP